MRTEPNETPNGRDADLELVEASRRGVPGAFDALVRRHEAQVVRLSTRILGDADAALDAAQETFVRAWKAIKTFAGDARFSTWLTRIAINQCRNELRRRRTVKHTQPLSIDAPGSAHAGSAHGGDAASALVDGLAGPSGDPYEAVRGRELEAALETSLAELDEEAREVLLLRDAEALSYEDIAAVLDVPVGTIRSRLHRARSDLHRRMAPVLGGQRTDGVPGGEHRP
jgi:RNA polymerase sigma-70 factor (ECF subfamily)